MKWPTTFLLSVSADDCYRAFVFGDSPLQFALRARADLPRNARVGEFLLSMGDGWHYRVPAVAQRFILNSSRRMLRGRTFTFENPFYIDPALSMSRHNVKPTTRLRAKESVRRG